jgi:hypothetical protein
MFVDKVYNNNILFIGRNLSKEMLSYISIPATFNDLPKFYHKILPRYQDLQNQFMEQNLTMDGLLESLAIK